MRPEKMLKRLVNLDGGFLNAYNSYSSACSTYVSPYIYGDASGGNSEADVLNSKLIILWGHNPSETIFGSLHNYYLAQAKARGIPIVVIDPRMSDTALSLAEEWILPGRRPTARCVTRSRIPLSRWGCMIWHFCISSASASTRKRSRGRACRLELPQLSRRLAGRRCQGRCLGRAGSQAFPPIQSSSWPTGLLRQNLP